MNNVIKEKYKIDTVLVRGLTDTVFIKDTIKIPTNVYFISFDKIDSNQIKNSIVFAKVNHKKGKPKKYLISENIIYGVLNDSSKKRLPNPRSKKFEKR